MTRIVMCLLLLISSVVSLKAQKDFVSSKFIKGQLALAVKQSENVKRKWAEKNFVSPRSIRHDSLYMVPSRDWTSGFFAGNLWYAFELINDPILKKNALAFTTPLDQEKLNGRTHDMGFKMFCSYGNAYRLTSDPAYKKILLQSARTLCTRFNPVVGCVRSWDHSRDKWGYPVIIDNMMNLELLFWAFRESGDSTFYKIAVRHADTTLKNHFRKDFSSYHVVDYDTLTGAVKARQTHQGYAHESAWARGQAWALYGYTMCYRETGKKEYLEHANRVAVFIFNHPRLPKDFIPYWDYDDPSIPAAPRDVSAAAIVASALIELSQFSKEHSTIYIDRAKRILKTLSTSYASRPGSNFGFLLEHSTGHLPGKHEIDVPIVYADYYFLEAIVRIRRTVK